MVIGKLFDLLNNRKKLVAREDGNAKVNIVGLQVKHFPIPLRPKVNRVALQEKQVVSEEELLNAMDAGNVARRVTLMRHLHACSVLPLNLRRSTAATGANADSSRSHAIMQVSCHTSLVPRHVSHRTQLAA